MHTIDVTKDIIIPLVSAIIGVAFSLIAVHIAMKHESENRKADLEQQTRPFFTIVDLTDTRILESNQHIFSFSLKDSYSSTDPHINACIVNSEKNEFLVEKVVINGKDYFTWSSNMVARGMSCMLRIYHDNQLSGDSVILHVIDTNYKNRRYIMTHDGSMVKSIKEV